jgi:hypothetical protein
MSYAKIVNRSIYKGVTMRQMDGKTFYVGTIPKAGEFGGHQCKFETEREAAIAVDTWMIKRGERPTNILKRIP